MMSALAAALDYLLEHDLSVIALHTPMPGWGCSCRKGQACATPGKHPRISEWKHLQERRATEAEVRMWWSRWPDANLGVITGMVSRTGVLDVDPRNGGGETLADLDGVGATVPDDNAVVETGSLGLHQYFRLDARLPKAAPFEGIEVQADGGLVVAPPSLHHSGRRYRWLRGLDSPWTPLPEWVRWACARTNPPRAETPTGSLLWMPRLTTCSARSPHAASTWGATDAGDYTESGARGRRPTPTTSPRPWCSSRAPRQHRGGGSAACTRTAPSATWASCSMCSGCRGGAAHEHVHEDQPRDDGRTPARI